MNNFPWDQRPDADAMLREEWAAGTSTSAIAAVMTQRLRAPFTKSSIIGRAHRLKLPSRASPIKRDAAKRGAAEVNVAAARVVKEKRRQGRPRKVVVSLPPVVAAIEPAPPPPPLPAMKRDGCKFPLWSSKERPTHRYCDKPRATGTNGVPTGPYCPHHHRLCTVRAISLTDEQIQARQVRAFLMRAAKGQQDGRTKLIASTRLAGEL